MPNFLFQLLHGPCYLFGSFRGDEIYSTASHGIFLVELWSSLDLAVDPEHTIRCSIASSNYTRARPSTQSCPSHEVLSLTWCLKLIWAAGGYFSGSGPGSCNNGHHFERPPGGRVLSVKGYGARSRTGRHASGLRSGCGGAARGRGG